jgi:hypothetical protein
MCNCRNVPPLYTFISCIYICIWINKPLLYVKGCLFNSLLSLQVHCKSIFFCRIHCSVYPFIWYHRKKLMKCQTQEHLGGSDTNIYFVACSLYNCVLILFFIVTHIKVALLKLCLMYQHSRSVGTPGSPVVPDKCTFNIVFSYVLQSKRSSTCRRKL